MLQAENLEGIIYFKYVHKHTHVQPWVAWYSSFMRTYIDLSHLAKAGFEY